MGAEIWTCQTIARGLLRLAVAVMLTRFTELLLMILFLIVTTEAKAQSGWNPQDSGTSVTLYDVFAADSLKCWVVGWQSAILHTTDGGETWIGQFTPEPGANTGVFFIDANTGWVVGTGGDILQTTDGGDNWNVQPSGIFVDLWGVHFIDGNNGWAVGGQWYPYFGNLQILMHTTDGGSSWDTQLYELYEPTLRDVFFFDASTGYAVGDGATILATTDGGTTWSEQTSGVTGNLEDVCFTSPDTGFSVGEFGTILHTIDGGANWDQISTGTTDHLRGIWFVDDNAGWSVGGSGTSATIMHTYDAGETWEFQDAGISSHLRAVHFVDATHGWAVGANGIILHTTSGGSTSIGDNPAGPAGQGLVYGLSNCPEPFSAQTTISFCLGNVTHVRLQLFDLSGRLRQTIIDEILPAGEHLVQLLREDLQPGVYIFRLSTNSEAMTETCVLIQ
jgi:photosystem II stability/assembly factor-like uncharacterized protein